MILDVGSGQNPLPNALHVDLNPEAKNLDCRCTAYYLPFPDGSFKIVYASHVLEHLEDPIEALNEFKRVCQSIVMIKTPNAQRACVAEDPTHLFSWTANTLSHLLNGVFPRITLKARLSLGGSKLDTLKGLLLAFFSSPNELVAVGWKET